MAKEQRTEASPPPHSPAQRRLCLLPPKTLALECEAEDGFVS